MRGPARLPKHQRARPQRQRESHLRRDDDDDEMGFNLVDVTDDAETSREMLGETYAAIPGESDEAPSRGGRGSSASNPTTAGTPTTLSSANHATGLGYGTIGAATLLVADCVGTGVLALPGDAWTLGLAAFGAFMLLNVGLNLYAGGLLNAAAAHKRADERPRDFLELAKRLECPATGVRLIEVAWYANLLLVLGQYLLVMTRGLDLLFGKAPCGPLVSAAAAGFAFVLAQANRTMLALDHGPSQVSILAVVVILALCIASLRSGHFHTDDDESSPSDGGAEIWADGDANSVGEWARHVAHRLKDWARPHHKHNGHERRSKMVAAAGAACGSVVFAVNSQKLLLNVRAEMASPSRADRALALALLVYVAAYCAVVVAAGPDPPAFLLDVFFADGDDASGRAKRTPRAKAVGALLFAHVAVSYAINQQALAATVVAKKWGRAVAGVVDPWPRLHWGLVTFALTALAWLIANAVPFFADLVALIGALTSAPLSFVVPPLLYRLAFPNAHGFGTAILLLFTAAVLLTGTAGAVASIYSHWEEMKRPFHC